MKKLIAAALCAILALAVLGAIPAFAAELTFTIEAADAKVGEGAQTAKFDVYFKDIPSEGLGAVMFEVKVEGATFSDMSIGPDMPGSFMPGQTGKDTMSLLWVDISKGIREDVLAATFRVKLPEGLKAGDTLPVTVVLSDDPDNYASFDADPATGEGYAVTPSAKDAKITVVPSSEAPVDDAEADSADATGRLDPALETGSVEVKAPETTAAVEEESSSGSMKTVLIVAAAVAAVFVAAAVVAAIVTRKKK